MTISGNMPVAVVAFSNGNHEHGPVQFGTLPSYQEATSKPSTYPPPYYTTGMFHQNKVILCFKLKFFFVCNKPSYTVLY